MKYDLSCKCRNNKVCYSPYNKNYVKNRNKALSTFGKKGATKLAKLSAPGIKQVNSVFNGTFDHNKFDFNKSKEINEKLVKVQKKMEPKVEERLKSLGFKIYSLEDRKKRLKKYYDKAISKELKEKFRKEGFKHSNYSSNSNKRDSLSNKTIMMKLEKKKEREQLKIPKSEIAGDERLKAALGAIDLKRKKSFKIATIYFKTDNIFEKISSRYKIKYFDKDSVSKIIDEQRKLSVKKSLRSIVNKLKRTR